MELTKADKRQLHDLIKCGVLRRCEEWLKETAQLINTKTMPWFYQSLSQFYQTSTTF